MKRFFLLCLIFAICFFAACSGGSKDKKDADNQNETVNDTDDTDTVTDNDDTDTASESEDGDQTDTASENDNDNIPADTDDDSDTATDNDVVPESNPCDENPCANVEHSTGKCESEGIGYFCECTENYDWNGKECGQIAPECGNEEGIVPCYDPESKLYWSSKTELFGAEEKAAYCQGIIDGYSGDWHMPTIDELRTLVKSCDKIKPDGTCPVTAENNSSEGFNDDSCSCNDTSSINSKLGDGEILWSSTKSSNETESWYIDFSNATLSFGLDENGIIRCAAKNLTNLRVIGRICSGQNECYKKVGEEDSGYGFMDEIYEETNCEGIENEFAGQDGHYAQLGFCVPADLTLNDNIPDEATVIDNNLGLEWQQNAQTNKSSTWEEAKKYCEDLVYAEHDDWRLPNAYELNSLLDYGFYTVESDGIRNTVSIDIDYFTEMEEIKYEGAGMFYWSSSALNYPRDEQDAFTSDPWEGESLWWKTDIKAFVRCVRGRELDVKGAFAVKTVNGEKVVVDYRSHLTWQPAAEEETTWLEALSYCENSKYAGFDDWRLPNVKELSTLINYDKTNPATDFPEKLLRIDGERQDFWSSTSAMNFSWAYLVEIGHHADGEIFTYRKSAQNGDYGVCKVNVMCIR